MMTRRIFRSAMLITMLALTAFSANSQTDTVSTVYPYAKIDGADTVVVFTAAQARAIHLDALDLDHCKRKTAAQARALSECSLLVDDWQSIHDAQAARLSVETSRLNYWKRKAKKRNRDKWIAIGGGTLVTVLFTSIIISR